MAEKAQSAMRLPLTITEPARNTLMPLPFWPLPPLLAAMPSMRLADDDGGVFARRGPPHQNAVVAAVAHLVMRDLKSGGVLAEQTGFADIADLAILDPARHFA